MSHHHIKKVLVSVIIPAYNAVKYIRHAVYSALLQSLNKHEFEVIVIDDCSTDDTAGAVALIRSMNVGRVNLIMRKENGGPAKALNDGIRETKGDWIKWLSADDEMYPSCLEDLLWWVNREKIKKEKELTLDVHTDAIYYTDYDYIDEAGKVTGEFIEPGRPESDLWKLFFGNGSSSFIHRSVFEKCGLFAEMAHSEDYEFWLRASQLYGIKLIHIPIKSIKYRKHAGQLTHRVGGQLDQTIKDSIRERQSEMLHSSSGTERFEATL